MESNNCYTYSPKVRGQTKVHKNACRGDLNRLSKNINGVDSINIYLRSKYQHQSPLYLAISNGKIDASNMLLDIYESDLRFIVKSIDWCNSKFWRHIPILIGFGHDDIETILTLYKEYSEIETSSIDTAKCTIVLLKRDNFTPVQVICLSPQTDRGKQIALKIVNCVIENGRLDLNGAMTGKKTLLYATAATGSITIFNRLCDLGAHQDAIELFIASMQSGQMDMLKMIYERYPVKMCSVLESEEFLNSVFTNNKPMVHKFVFDKYFEQNEHETWESLLRLQLKPFGRTIFQQAITDKYFEFAEFCLQHNPDLFQTDSLGYIPIHNVTSSDDRAKDFIKKLIEIDDKLLMIGTPDEFSVLHLIVQNNWIDLILEIFDKHPNARTAFYRNWNLIRFVFENCFENEYYEMAETLLIQGRDHLQDTNTILILDSAIAANRIDLVKTIFDIFKPTFIARTTDWSTQIINTLFNRHLNIYNFIVEQTKFDLRTVLDDNELNLLFYAFLSKEPRYVETPCGSLYDLPSIYQDDSEDEEDKKLGLLPKLQESDVNDLIEKFDRLFDELIELGIDYHHTCSRNSTLLHHTVEANNLYATKRLLELGVDLSAYNNEGNQAIHYATNLEMFQLLNSWTTNSFINSKNSVTGETPLHKYVQLPASHIDLARYILQNGGDVNAIDNDGRTPIFQVYNVEYVELLLEHQANVNLRDIYGNTPIHLAFVHSNPKVITLLFQQPNTDYCAVNNNGTSYLERFVDKMYIRGKPSQVFQSICSLNNPEFKRLLDTHCNTRNEHGSTVIGNHNLLKDEIMMDMLLSSAHINLDVRENGTGNTLLHKAVEHSDASLFDKLIERGLSIDVLNNNNNTPLLLCCPYRFEMLATIMKHKPNVNIANKYGMTAIVAASKGIYNARACSELLAAGGNIFDVDENGNTAYSMMDDDLKQIFIFLT